ncbi:hypothetical protein ACFL1H_04695 [Nanoarchaeota archaeon]
MSRLSNIVHGIEFGIGLGMVGIGEHLQVMAALGERDPDFLTKHLTDIGYSGGMTAIAMICSHYSHRLKAALAIPTAMTILEGIVSISPNYIFDIKDVACYYGAALFTYGLNRILDKKEDQNFIQRLYEAD